MTAWSCRYINLCMPFPFCSNNFSLLWHWALTYFHPNTSLISNGGKKKNNSNLHTASIKIFGERIKPQESCQPSYIPKLMCGRVEEMGKWRKKTCTNKTKTKKECNNQSKNQNKSITHTHTTQQTLPAAALQRKGRGKEEPLILYSTLGFLDAIVQLLDVTSGSNILTHITQLYLSLLASTPNPSWKCQQNSKRSVSTWKGTGTREATLIRTEETFGKPSPKINLPPQSKPHVLHPSHQYETLNLIWLQFLATLTMSWQQL